MRVEEARNKLQASKKQSLTNLAELILMLQFDGMHSRYRENVGHRSRRYRKRHVASQPACLSFGRRQVCDGFSMKREP